MTDQYSPPEYARPPELAIVSLLFMLSRQHAANCPAMAASIAAHVRFVANDPRMSDILREAAQRLGVEGQEMLETADYRGGVH